jgi:tetratricopeptide (TPR) repeat protein
VKHGKVLLSAALAIAAVTVAVLYLRADGAGVKPEAWIVDAAVAWNRESIPASPHGTAHIAGDRRDEALRAAHAGQQLRVQRRFDEAADAFRQALEADPADADSWADLADCQAAAAGNDLNAGREAIMHALRIDPRHRKALWLRASLELQEQRYPAAAATWRDLLTLMPADSTDARVIQANIAEADALSQSVSIADERGS